MKDKKTLSRILAGVLLVFVIGGCANKAADEPDRGFRELSDLYSFCVNDDNTFSCRLTDFSGKVLFERDHAVREPKMQQITPTVFGFVTQAGTGLSTNWAVYCDVENSRVSETFQYVLMAQGEYVIYVNYENGEYKVVVQNIFDKTAYCKEYVLTNCSDVAADIVTRATPNGEGVAVVTYLTGEDYAETELIIHFP